MKAYKIMFLAASIGWVQFCNAQTYTDPLINKPLDQSVTSLPLKMVNSAAPTVKLSDFKDRLVILDFWATWCAPCVAFLTKADTLQKHFGDKILILPVTYEDSSKVMTFFKGLKRVKGIDAASAVGDKRLSELFQHATVPHEAWIRPGDQKVIATTDDLQVNVATIDKVLNNEKVDWQMKNELPNIPIDYEKPVLTGNNQVKVPDSSILYKVDKPGYSFLLTKQILRLGGMSASFSNLEYGFNLGVELLYEYNSMGEESDVPGIPAINQVRVKVRDTSATSLLPSDSNDPALKLSQLEYQKWCANKNFCFELLLKDTTLNVHDITRRELNNYFKKFDIEAHKETVLIPCYILKRTSTVDKVKSAGGDTKEVLNTYQLSYRNCAFNNWTLQLKGKYLQLTPFLDETGLGEENVDMDLVCKMTNIDSINQALEKYDLKIVKENRKVRQLVIANIK